MMAVGLGVGLPYGSRGAFTPLDLGASLYDMWDAERTDLISLSGAAVTAWRSSKNAYSAAQAVGAARPFYSATSFNGRPGITFDGSDDELTYEAVPFPIGADPCEIWALVDQTALPADTTARHILAYGTSTNNSRRLVRIVNGGVNNGGIAVGNGAAAISAASTADFSGRHVVRGQVGATSSSASLDGAALVSNAVVPNTTVTRTRIGAFPGGAAGFLQGVASIIAITAPLTAPQAAQMLAYLKARGGIA